MATEELEKSRKNIMSLYSFTDKDVKEACLALDNAIEIYYNYEVCNIPERIDLINYDGDIIYNIRTATGKFESIKIGPKPYGVPRLQTQKSINIWPIMIVLSSALIVSIVIMRTTFLP